MLISAGAIYGLASTSGIRLRPPRDQRQRRDARPTTIQRPGRPRAGNEPRRADHGPDRRAPPRDPVDRIGLGLRRAAGRPPGRREGAEAGRRLGGRRSPLRRRRRRDALRRARRRRLPGGGGAAGRQRRADERGRARDPVGPRSGRPGCRQAAGLDHPGADRQPRPEARRDRDRREGVHARGRRRGCGPRSSACTARASGRRP